jgi:hypothetical protein
MATSTKELGPDKKATWRRPAAYTNDRPVLSSERAPHKNKTVTVKEQYISGHEPQMGLDAKTY